MRAKKVKGKAKGKAKPSAKNAAPATKKPVDMVRIRESINNLVGKSAKAIAAKVIEVAETTGQLASAKYLFEAAGLYPATEQTEAKPRENSLAYTLLTRMGLATEPVACDEEPEPALLTGGSGVTRETAEGAEKDPGSEPEEDQEPEGEQ